jgi:hypothetical protein
MLLDKAFHSGWRAELTVVICNVGRLWAPSGQLTVSAVVLGGFAVSVLKVSSKAA